MKTASLSKKTAKAARPESSAAGGSKPGAPKKPHPGPGTPPGGGASKRRIEHVVVLMLENRSFDHIFGFRAGVNGLKGSEFNLLNPSAPESDANPAFVVSNGAPFAISAGQGPGHSVKATNLQLCNDATGPSAHHPATNGGFVRSYKQDLFNDRVQHPSAETIRVVMEAFAPSRLPSINALADAFCVCDNWHAEVPGPTQPNRFYMHAATSAGFAFNNWKRVLDVPTIYNRLEAAGCSWATYAFDSNEVREFSQVSARETNFKQFQEAFAVDVRQNTLANYSFIIPRFFNSTHATHATQGLANSQHAPEDARYGDNLIADVYEALRSNPDLWAKSVMIVTYDEHGGFYDHVAPPSTGVPNPDGLNSPAPHDPAFVPAFSFDRLGLRVPVVIASPWVKRGTVDSTRYQHTSVLATLKKMFDLPSFLTRRDASANTFEALFGEFSTPRTDTPKTLPRAALPKITAALADATHPANQPLDPDQRDLLLKVYHLTKGSNECASSAELPATQGDAHDFIQASYRKHFGPPGKAGVRPSPHRNQ